MKKEVDFSNGERGKFHLSDAEFRVPVYLDEDARLFVTQIAERRKTDVSSVVNQLIRADKQLAEAVR
jgi:hypothetical protein